MEKHEGNALISQLNFYYINNSLDIKEVGVYPQVVDAQYYCSIFDEPRFIDKLNFQETITDPIVAHAILHKNAIQWANFYKYNIND